MTFAARAKALKEQSKMTLLEIATACNISESMASRYINGQNIPPEDIARKMLEVMSAAVPTNHHKNTTDADIIAICSAFEERIDDMRANISDLKNQLRLEKREKRILFYLVITIIMFVFALLYIDITNHNIGWFRA